MSVTRLGREAVGVTIFMGIPSLCAGTLHLGLAWLLPLWLPVWLSFAGGAVAGLGFYVRIRAEVVH